MMREVQQLQQKASSPFETAYFESALDFLAKFRRNLDAYYVDEMWSVANTMRYLIGSNPFELITDSRWCATKGEGYFALTAFKADSVLDDVCYQNRLKSLKDALPKFLELIKTNASQKANERQKEFLTKCNSTTLSEFIHSFYQDSFYAGTRMVVAKKAEMVEKYRRIPNCEKEKQGVLQYRQIFAALPHASSTVKLLDDIASGNLATLTTLEERALCDAFGKVDEELLKFEGLIKLFKNKNVYEDYTTYQEAMQWNALAKVVPLVYTKLKQIADGATQV